MLRARVKKRKEKKKVESRLQFFVFLGSRPGARRGRRCWTARSSCCRSFPSARARARPKRKSRVGRRLFRGRSLVQTTLRFVPREFKPPSIVRIGLETAEIFRRVHKTLIDTAVGESGATKFALFVQRLCGAPERVLRRALSRDPPRLWRDGARSALGRLFVFRVFKKTRLPRWCA